MSLNQGRLVQTESSRDSRDTSLHINTLKLFVTDTLTAANILLASSNCFEYMKTLIQAQAYPCQAICEVLKIRQKEGTKLVNPCLKTIFIGLSGSFRPTKKEEGVC